MSSDAWVKLGKGLAPWPLYAVAALLFLIDRLLKTVAMGGFSGGWAGVAEFTLFLNRGIAFSIPVPEAVFWPLAVLASAALVWSFGRSVRTDASAAGFLALVILGAASNLTDRVSLGATIDYLLFFGRSAVNLADGMILMGLAMSALRERGSK